MAHHDFQTTVLLRTEQSAGAVALVENTVPAGWPGPPLHHHDFDEAFYVLAGELTFQLGERRRVAGPGRAVVRERVVAAARCEHDLAGARDAPPFAELERQLAGEHVEGLVEVVVVQRRPGPARRDRVLDERDGTGALLGPQQDGGSGSRDGPWSILASR